MSSSFRDDKIKDILKKQQLSAFSSINQIKFKKFVFTKQQNHQQYISTIPKKTQFNDEQKLKIFIFISYFQDIFSQIKPKEIKWDVFKGMANFLLTRNFQQCRSYYLKTIQKFKNIQNYLLKGKKTIPNFLQKIKQKQAKLIQISQQFNFDLIYKKSDKTFIIKSNQITEVKQNITQNLLPQICIDKNLKIDQLKTADSYECQQIPVKYFQNKNSCSIFSNQSKFKPCNQTFNKPKKSSLQSFDDSDGQEPSIQKKQTIFQNPINSYIIPNFYSMKTEGILNQNPMTYSNPMIQNPYGAFPIYQMSTQANKMNNYIQIQQYYLQYWATPNIYYKVTQHPQSK